MEPKLQEVLAELAQKLGTTAEQLWPHLVRYRVANIVSATVVDALLFIVALAIALWFIPRVQKTKDSELLWVGSILGSIFSFVTFGMTVNDLGTLVKVLYEPQGATVIWLLDRMR